MNNTPKFGTGGEEPNPHIDPGGPTPSFKDAWRRKQNPIPNTPYIPPEKQKPADSTTE